MTHDRISTNTPKATKGRAQIASTGTPTAAPAAGLGTDGSWSDTGASPVSAPSSAMATTDAAVASAIGSTAPRDRRNATTTRASPITVAVALIGHGMRTERQP